MSKISPSWSKEHKIALLNDLLHDHEQDLLKTFEGEIPVSVKTLADYADKAEYELNHPDEFNGIKTGYYNLDRYLDGLGKGELIVLSGATSCGKTQLSQCICLNLALKDVSTVFFTFEMPPTEIYKRFRAMIMSPTIKRQPEETRDLPILVDPGSVSTVSGIEQMIKQAKEFAGVELAIIDHLQFFIKNGENTANEVGLVTRELKMMALRLEMPIILISHIRKLNHKGVPSIDDLKDSSSIGQDADTVIMVWRNQSEDDKTDSNTDKNRYVLAKIRKNRRKGFLQNVYFKSDDNFYLNEISESVFTMGAK